MKILLELSDEDVAALTRAGGPTSATAFGVALWVHGVVRRQARDAGGPGDSRVEWHDHDGAGGHENEVAMPPSVVGYPRTACPGPGDLCQLR